MSGPGTGDWVVGGGDVVGRVVQHRLDPGNWRAEHASDDAELLADLRRAGLGKDGADGRGDHLRRARGHLS